MAEQVAVTRQSITAIGSETTFGTAPGGMTRSYPRAGSFLTKTDEQLKRADERPTRTANQVNIQGRKRGAAQLAWDAKTITAQLTAGGAVVVDYLSIVLKALLGGQVAAVGDTVAASPSPTTTSFTVTTGANFPVGTWLAVVVSGVLYPRKVIAVATNTLTVWPALPNPPATSAIVLNSETSYVSQSNTQSLAFQLARPLVGAGGDNNFQHEISGATGDLGVTIEPGKIAGFTADLRAAAYRGPTSAIGLLPAAAAADPLGPPLIANGVVNWFGPSASLTATHVPMRKFSTKLNGSMIHLEEDGNVNGVTGVERVGGEFLFASAEAEKLYDPSFVTYYTQQTTLSLVKILQFGTGTAARFIVVEIPTCYITQFPADMDSSGVVPFKLTLEALEDTTITSPASDLARSPIRIIRI